MNTVSQCGVRLLRLSTLSFFKPFTKLSASRVTSCIRLGEGGWDGEREMGVQKPTTEKRSASNSLCLDKAVIPICSSISTGAYTCIKNISPIDRMIC